MNKAVKKMNGSHTLSPAVKRIVRVGLLCVVLPAAGGCGLIDKIPLISDEPVDDVDYAQVSANLIDAILQYPDVGPNADTYIASAADSEFEQQVYEDMEALGFMIASAGEHSSAEGVNAEISSSPGSMPGARLFGLSVGQVGVAREFAVRDGKTIPVSEMVFNTSTDSEHSIVLNDADIFDSVDANYSTVLFEPESAPADDKLFGARISAMRSSSQESEESLKAADPDEPLESRQQQLNSTGVTLNLYENQLQSNYAGILDEYQDLDQSVLIFPNDSLRLGENNKRVIQDFASKMNQETDVLSIIGCSHGTTEIRNGNALLALGRANRVKEALLFSGVEHDLLLDEGCWAPNEFSDALPARGVILTLKRRSES